MWGARRHAAHSMRSEMAHMVLTLYMQAPKGTRHLCSGNIQIASQCQLCSSGKALYRGAQRRHTCQATQGALSRLPRWGRAAACALLGAAPEAKYVNKELHRQGGQKLASNIWPPCRGRRRLCCCCCPSPAPRPKPPQVTLPAMQYSLLLPTPACRSSPAVECTAVHLQRWL